MSLSRLASSIVGLALVCAAVLPGEAAVVSGELVTWHEVVVDFTGPLHGEMDVSPNPFLDYRLQVRFTAPVSGTVYDVPGFFDGDGNGGASGTVWRVRFAPDEPGTWNYVASFRSGAEVAVDLGATAGTPTGFDGESGSFDVAAADPNAPGFLARGRLESVGEHHLRFRDGTAWLKLGMNNPENLLGYSGFDNTPNAWHSFSSHVAEWQPGDPDWDSPDRAGTNDGRGIIGALNYIAGQEMNSIYFMPMNIGADGKDTWPYADPAINRDGSASNDNLHFDISKLTQWEIVFDHAQRKGLFLHWVLSDKTVANKNELDNATLGVERKLFYREMIARFGHHNALQWNICEEYNLDLPLNPDVIKQFGTYIDAVDPYDHPVTVHSHGNTYKSALAPFLAEAWFKTMSVQTWQRPEDIGMAIEYFRTETTAVGNPIPVNLDECIGMNQMSAADYRKRTFWDALLSGGGFEMFKSYGDSDFDDLHIYAQHYEFARYALRFVEDHLPYETMQPADGLVTGADPLWGGAETFALAGEYYAIYLPKATPEPTLDLGGVGGTFEQRWYNPRTGLFEGTPISVSGGGPVALGAPPSDPDQDWAILIRTTDFPPTRSNGQPNGVLPQGTTGTTLSLDTDVAAECRHSAVPETAYEDMTESFDVTGGTTHSTAVAGLEDGRAYAYNVRCASVDGGPNVDDWTIHFTVDAADGRPIGDRAVWNLDEGSGSVAADSSGNGNVGALYGAPGRTVGYSGGALDLDGADDHVRVANSPSLDLTTWPAASVAAWVKPRRLDHTVDQTIYGLWGDAVANRPFQILLGPDNLLRCRTNHEDGLATALDPVVADAWTHVACVWTPAGLTLYVDGVEVAFDVVDDNTLSPTDGVHTLGAREKGGAISQHFDGLIDEVHMFARALSASEVATLFASIECVDADGDGLRRCDGDCDEANPDCTTDCTDADGDGICVTHDCDDATPSAGTVAFTEAVTAADRDSFVWTTATDVRWRMGDLAAVGDLATIEAGSMISASSLDVSTDVPTPGTGLYYLIRDVGCGSWQTVPGEQPSRDADLPLP